jgi:hypothetical protein
LCYAILLMLHHSLFLSLLPWIPQSSSTVTNMFYIWVCIWSSLFLCYLPCMRKNMGLLCFWSWFSSVNMISSNCIHLSSNVVIPYGWVILHCVCVCVRVCMCVYVSQFHNPFISCKVPGLFPKLGYCR